MSPFYFSNGNNVMIIVSKDSCENKLSELHGLTVEADNEYFFYLMGTDAWGELLEKDEVKYLVFKSTDKNYFECIISDEILEKLEQENGFMLVETEVPITLAEIQEAFGESCEFEDIEAWMREKEEENGLEIGGIDGTLCCFFTEADKKEYGI